MPARLPSGTAALIKFCFLALSAKLSLGEKSKLAEDALAQDDACALSSAVGCGLAALQVAQGRHSAAPLQADVSQTQDPWVLSEGRMRGMLSVPKGGFWDGIASFFAPFAVGVPFCQSYVSYFWPMLSFWTKETMRRFDVVAEDDEESLKRARTFAQQASFLANVWEFDPRAGAPWASVVQAFMNNVSASDSLDMPPLPEMFRRSSLEDVNWAADVSTWWFSSMMCDLDFWRKEIMGSRADSKELCWDQVTFPGYAYSPFVSLQPNLRAWPADYDYLNYPEYAACQDGSLNDTFIEAVCPFGGHAEAGLWGVPSWGTGVQNPDGREQVLQCLARMGPAAFYNFSQGTTVLKYPYSPSIDLGERIDDGPVSTDFDMKSAFDQGQINPETVRLMMKKAWDLPQYEKVKKARGIDALDPFEGNWSNLSSYREFEASFRTALTDIIVEGFGEDIERIVPKPLLPLLRGLRNISFARI